MTLYFAYGSNMSRALMRANCAMARPIGIAVLDHHRFIINADGYATIVPQHDGSVHGVLWRLTKRNVAALDIYESVNTGLYSSRSLVVRCRERRLPALVYLARSRAEGRPGPGYLEAVIEAALDWDLPGDYVAALTAWAAAELVQASAPGGGEDL